MGMRVFVTGASGYLGAAIAARLVKSDCEVQGLVRNEERAEAIASLGVKPVIGDLDKPETFLSDLKNNDAVVHAASGAQPDTARLDRLVLETIRAGVADGRVRRVLYTSGVWVHGDTGDRVDDETSPLHAAEYVSWRPAHEEVALDMVEQEAHVTVMRPGMVYGGTRGEFAPWFREAREKKMVTYPGTGAQHWSTVHLSDVAEGYRLALEHARGANRFLLVDESHFTVRELAEAVARAADAQAQPSDPAELRATLGTYGAALLLDQRLTAAKARRELGWVPRHPSFVNEVADLYGDWRAGERTAGA
jgi:nucleoside-diphosphate-sugar epimerase